MSAPTKLARKPRPLFVARRRAHWNARARSNKSINKLSRRTAGALAESFVSLSDSAKRAHLLGRPETESRGSANEVRAKGALARVRRHTWALLSLRFTGLS